MHRLTGLDHRVACYHLLCSMLAQGLSILFMIVLGDMDWRSVLIFSITLVHLTTFYFFTRTVRSLGVIADYSIVVTCTTVVNIVTPALELTTVYPLVPIVIMICIVTREVVVDHYIAMMPIKATEEKVRRDMDTRTPIKASMVTIVMRVTPVIRSAGMPPTAIYNTSVIKRYINNSIAN